ncbi:D(1A) dopamine receptor-like [Rhopilema esculentum]|uniref:D(1A) dopamine receptor-like n=1 Tax=Rhopilema esculentum TaxID=499914 RepID=UPI0031D41108
MVANTISLVVLYKVKDYRKMSSTYYLCSILVANILACLYEIPYYTFSVVYDLPSPDGDKHKAACRASVFLTYATSTVKIYLLTALSVDRYIALSFPFLYDEKCTKTKAILANAVAWMLPIMFIIPLSAIDGLAIYMGVVGTACGINWNTVNKAFFMTIMTFCFVLPCVITAFTNIKVFFIAKRQKRSISSQSTRLDNDGKDVACRELTTVYGIDVEKQTDVSQASPDRSSTQPEKFHKGNETVARESESLAEKKQDLSKQAKGTGVEDTIYKDTEGILKTKSRSGDISKKVCRVKEGDKPDHRSQSVTYDKNVPKRNEISMLKRGSRILRVVEWNIVLSTLILVAAFFITWAPFAISRVYESFQGILGDRVILYTTAPTLLDIIHNPVIIVGTRRRLRQKIYKLLCCKS